MVLMVVWIEGFAQVEIGETGGAFITAAKFTIRTSGVRKLSIPFARVIDFMCEPSICAIIPACSTVAPGQSIALMACSVGGDEIVFVEIKITQGVLTCLKIHFYRKS